MKTLVDNMDRLAQLIIETFKKGNYYKVFNSQLIADSNNFIPILINNYKEPELFLEVLNRILSAWRPILNDKIIGLIVNYRNNVMAYKSALLQRQKELILFSNSLEIEKRNVDKEIDNITDALGDMFSSTGELNNMLRKSKISSSIKKPEFKKPSARRKK